MQATDYANPAAFEEESVDIGQYLEAFKRRRYWFIVPFILIAAAACVLAFVLPPTYESKGTILIEAQDIPLELVRSPVSTFATQQIQIITKRVTTVSNVEKIVRKYDLYNYSIPGERPSPTEMVDRFLEDMDVDLISAEVIDPRSGRAQTATIAFSISFKSEQSATAQKVANELVTLFLDENVRARTQQVSGALEFLSSEAKELAAELSRMDAKLAQFKIENQGALPEQRATSQGVVERSEREILDLNLAIQRLERQRVELMSKLAQAGSEGATSLGEEDAMSDAQRLQSLQAQYREASARYHDKHPDIQWLKREIEVLQMSLASGETQSLYRDIQAKRLERDRLQAEQGADSPAVIQLNDAIAALERQLEVARNKPAAAISDEAVRNNPAYRLIMDEVRAIALEVSGLKERRTQIEKVRDQYQGNLQRMPEVEQAYSSMVRDYQSGQAKYQDLRAKLREAEVSKALEHDRKGERFTLIEPPIASKKPVSPNRPAILFIGFVLAAGVGLGLVFLLEMLDEGIRGDRALTRLMGAAPLVVIPYLETEVDQRRLHRRRMLAAAVVLVALLGSALSVHLLYKPLDVVWYIVMNRLG